MMNKTTTTSNSTMIMGMLTAAKRVTNTYDNMMNHVTDFYSKQLERNINRRQTLALLEAQLAFFLGIMPIDMPMILRIAFTVWTVVAVKKCKRCL
jgi:type II secretory pathway component PulF